jgi:hypothetical protein
MIDDSDIFDFGFTAVAEDELDSARVASAKEDELVAAQAQLDSLYKSVLPLIANLKKNPEKDYIYWPNRLDKVKAFEQLLLKIYEGK